MREGLARAAVATSPYLEVKAGYSSLAGPLASVEAGVRPLPGLALVALGQWTPREWLAGVAARYSF